MTHFKVHSPYLIKFIEAFEYRNTYFIVKENFLGHILTSVIKAGYDQDTEYGEDFCVYTLYCIGMGLKDMHDKFLIHRDIQPNNIFFDPDGNVKISGLSQVYFLTEQEPAIRQRPTFEVRSPAPEMLTISQDGYGKPVDVWAMGILAYELMTGFHKPLMAEESKEVLSAEAYQQDESRFSPTYQAFI